MKKLWCLAWLFACGVASAQYYDREITTCESTDFRYNSCRVGYDVDDVRLYRQLSKASCDEGSSWGFSQGRIWVDHGCRAQFELISGRRQDPITLKCESDDQRFQRCYVNAPSIRSVELVQRLSKASCNFRDSWGFDRDSVWVDRGCRAVFQVYPGRRW